LPDAAASALVLAKKRRTYLNQRRVYYTISLYIHLYSPSNGSNTHTHNPKTENN